MVINRIFDLSDSCNNKDRLNGATLLVGLLLDEVVVMTIVWATQHSWAKQLWEEEKEKKRSKWTPLSMLVLSLSIDIVLHLGQMKSLGCVGWHGLRFYTVIKTTVHSTVSNCLLCMRGKKGHFTITIKCFSNRANGVKIIWKAKNI